MPALSPGQVRSRWSRTKRMRGPIWLTAVEGDSSTGLKTKGAPPRKRTLPWMPLAPWPTGWHLWPLARESGHAVGRSAGERLNEIAECRQIALHDPYVTYPCLLHGPYKITI